jgi:thiol-disulfide isomerase/thioredoxin
MKRILRFTASWCGPCQGLAMNLETASLDLPIEVIDIDIHNDIAQEYGVRSVPTLVMLDGNIEVKRLIGSRTVNQLQEWAQ